MAVSKATTSATTKLSVAPSLPANYTEAGFELLTGWIDVSEISNLGTFGGTTTVVTHIPIDTSVVVKRAGSKNYGQMSMTLARHSGTDTDELVEAFNDRLPRSFRVTLPSVLGQIDFFTAIVTSIQTNVAGADNILETNVTLELDAEVITTTV